MERYLLYRYPHKPDGTPEPRVLIGSVILLDNGLFVTNEQIIVAGRIEGQPFNRYAVSLDNTGNELREIILCEIRREGPDVAPYICRIELE